MALRKLYIVVDCENDEQKEAVQTAFNELSNTRALTSRTVISMYPFFKNIVMICLSCSIWSRQAVSNRCCL